jgi:DUF4097 and DUF4098 domain-containing protein YvlB
MQRHIAPIFALIFAFVLAAPAAAQGDRDRDRGPRETETVDRTLSLPPGGTVRLKTFSGRVNITGTGGNQVVIKAVRRASRERLDDIRLEITQSGNVIDIDANHRIRERRNDNVVETDFDIQVPNEVRLDLRTFSAPITVNNVGGDLVVEGFSSEIRLTDVAGPKRVKTFSGKVTVQARSWADGDDMNVNTFSGDVTLRLPDTRAATSRSTASAAASTATCRSRCHRAAGATSAARSTAAAAATSGSTPSAAPCGLSGKHDGHDGHDGHEDL